MREEMVVQLDTSLDHLTGEEIGFALRELNDMPEILDAIYLAGIGKKNRPAGLLQVLCHKVNEKVVINAIFRHTHTLGLRRQEITRMVLERGIEEIELEHETGPAKAYYLHNRQYLRPEADFVQKIAKAANIGMPALRFAAKQAGNEENDPD